ncbi:MAG: bifunctional glutamate N-acetyltransferase/amino-acid acetyltransferase ArgJ [Proteobacteria bacterium]|nr:bifunctional glutamate N-acetyltransferase/amino-acid acetyltransferase ArgJ [Pseudomonadota bacterium]MBU1639010.1 bifunctional glutamate N-acetyltransferase/amino-acid acetyltransferase ArgJ [Pseudomonadota bacterium]
MVVPGFKAAAVKAGIRGKDRLDMALIYSEKPAAVAGCFTTSQVKAAPVLLDMEHLKSGSARAILVNSGVANACSGAQGMAFAKDTAVMVAQALAVQNTDVHVCSTGVIGQQLEMAWFNKGVPALVTSLSPGGFGAVAQAMMTTDTVPKVEKISLDIGGREVSILGLAKGAGMIMPNMATMLSFVMTDAAIAVDVLQAMLSKAVAQSFNVITVDGDTSTNDTVLLLANGVAGHEPLVSVDSPEAQLFQEALDRLTKNLALKIVADGEGATKLITVRVQGAVNNGDAEKIGRTIANSPLFKTACFGEDANWGRIFAAAGRAGVDFDQSKVDIFFDEVQMVAKGLGLFANEAAATQVLKQEDFVVTVDLHSGSDNCEIYTCDFSYEYVKINGDYRS